MPRVGSGVTGNSHRSLGLAVIVAASFACTATAAEQAEAPVEPCQSVASIGVGWMSQDGVITLHIGSLPPGPRAEGFLVYKPGDPQYDDIKQHLGGLAPGEFKPVPPWC